MHTTHYTIRYEPASFTCNEAVEARWEQTYLKGMSDEEAIKAILDGDFTFDLEFLDPVEHDLRLLSKSGVHLFRADDSKVGLIFWSGWTNSGGVPHTEEELDRVRRLLV